MDYDEERNLYYLMASMNQRGKEPKSAGVLDSWIDHAEAVFGIAASGRVRWLVASTVITAMLQQVVDENHVCRFSLKGGTLLQHVLGLASRATKDIDGIVHGDLDEFLELMDEQFLNGSWGPFEFRRSEVAQIRVPGKIVYPRRFDVIVSLRNKTWRKVKVEVSPDEGMAGSAQEDFQAPPLEGFGIPTPEKLVGMAMCYQAAQKIHAVTAPHDPGKGYRNNRPRDLVDLVLIKRLSAATGHPSNWEIKQAVIDIFNSRAKEAIQASRDPRTWPAQVVVHSHWDGDYRAAADSVDLGMNASEAAEVVNDWLREIDEARPCSLSSG